MVYSTSLQITFCNTAQINFVKISNLCSFKKFLSIDNLLKYLTQSRKYGIDLKLLHAKTFFFLQCSPNCHVKITICFRVEYKDRKFSLLRKIIEDQQHKSHMFIPIFSKERFIRQTPTLYTLTYNNYECISWYNCNSGILEQSVVTRCRDM